MGAAATAIIAAISAVIRWAAAFFSDTNTLKRVELAQERAKAKEEVEGERLKATYERIDNEPAKTGPEVVDELNKRFAP